MKIYGHEIFQSDCVVVVNPNNYRTVLAYLQDKLPAKRIHLDKMLNNLTSFYHRNYEDAGIYISTSIPMKTITMSYCDQAYPSTLRVYPTTDKPITTTTQLFKVFLKEHRAYASFKRQIDWEDNSIKNLVTSMGAVSIDEALHWSNTEEGATYWHKLHKQWRALYQMYAVNLKGYTDYGL